MFQALKIDIYVKKQKLVLKMCTFVTRLVGIIPNHISDYDKLQGNKYSMFQAANTRVKSAIVPGNQNGQICDEIEVSLKMYTNCEMAC